MHRAVAIAFIPNPLNLPQVNHKDGCKTNNQLTNLEWSTNIDNITHAIDNNLMRRVVGKDSCKFTGTVQAWKDGVLVHELNGNLEMAAVGLDFRLVHRCLKGISKTHKGFTFIKLKKEN